MKLDYRDGVPDGLIAFQSILYSAKNPNIIGNAFLNNRIGIFIMYDSSGEYVDAIVEEIKEAKYSKEE
jgi:parallel beta-helix repeat protein